MVTAHKTQNVGMFGFTLVILLIVIIFPFVWMLMSSLKTQVDIIAWPPRFIFTPTLQNFKRVFVEQNFLLYLKNSVVVAFGAVMFSLLLGLPAAYSITRLQKTKIYVRNHVARLLPGISVLMPWYVVFSRLHLMDSYIALILSHMLIALPLIVWTMSPYFGAVPRELEEAAMVDGLPQQKSFLLIVLPLSMPGIVTATTLSFIFSWNNFMFSQVLSQQRTRTLPIAVYNFLSYVEVDWGAVMAAAVAIMFPAIVLTMIFQKYVVQGLTAGAVKG